MDYEEAQDYLSGLLKFGIKFGLDRFEELCRRMGNPQERLRVIHVGGTNGKGSTCTFITSILRAAGYTVGTYLSPYVYDVRERIQVNGEMVTKRDFASLMTEIAPHLEAVAPTELGQGTEFEAKTLMAFLQFARANVDYSVIEVGMGGRYDCTNVVHPLVSVITNVSLDHTERLGDTIAKIAWDKAGIAKAGAMLVTAADSDCGLRIADCGSSTAACSGRAPSRPWAPQEPDEAWRTIAATAREQGVKEIWRVLRNADCGMRNAESQADRVIGYEGSDGQATIHLPYGTVGPVTLRLAGDFQVTNAATAAAAAVSALRQSEIRIPKSAIERGLASAYLPGRLEVLRRRPSVVIDAAHNPDGAAKLAESIRSLFSYRRLILVVGMLVTHSAEEVLAILAPLADEVIATRSQWDKARPASELAETARKLCQNVRTIEPVQEAVHQALESASEDDLVLITGSFYTIGEVDRITLHE